MTTVLSFLYWDEYITIVTRLWNRCWNAQMFMNEVNNVFDSEKLATQDLDSFWMKHLLILLSLKVSNESRLSIFPRLVNDMSRSGPLLQHQRKSFQGNTVATHWSKDRKVCLRGSSELGCAPLTKESLNYHSTGLVVKIRQLHIPTLGIGTQNNSKRPT